MTPESSSTSSLRKRGSGASEKQPPAPPPRRSPKPSAATGATTTRSLFFLYASLAGTCGALSAVVGKIAVASSLAPRIASSAVAFLSACGVLPLLLALFPKGEALEADAGAGRPALPEEQAMARLTVCVEAVLRVGFFCSNAFFVGQMWRFFLKSLSLGPTPVSQIINTGTNFAVSALLGLVFFREEVNVMWAAGALLVVVGLALVVTDPQAAKATAG